MKQNIKDFYFPHDCHASSDEKITRLIMCGWEYYGLFWAIVEKLHKEGGYLKTDYEALAFAMHSQCDVIKRIIEGFDLFIIEHDQFTSKRVLDNLSKRHQKSIKARQSANERWGNDAIAMRSQCEGNARKERKGKEIKVIQGFDLFWSKYPKKVGKENARKAFQKIDFKEFPLETILSAVDAQRGSDQWTRDGGKFIPHPATWINGKRWQDEIAIAKLDPYAGLPKQSF